LIHGSLYSNILRKFIAKYCSRNDSQPRLPLVAISKAEKWSEGETLKVTTITGFSHTLSTVIIGIIVGMIGYKLSNLIIISLIMWRR
jgi:hypothetical protein